MLLLCKRRRLQNRSCSICGYISALTRKFCLLTYQRRWRGASSFAKKFSFALESFWYSPRNSSLFCISFLEYCAGTRPSPFEVLCKRTNGWFQVGLDRRRTDVFGTSPNYPINCCSSLRCSPCPWLNVLSRDSASVHTKSINISDNCACAKNIFLS